MIFRDLFHNRNQNNKKADSFESIGGVFLNRTIHQPNEEDSQERNKKDVWVSSGSVDHHKDSPTFSRSSLTVKILPATRKSVATAVRPGQDAGSEGSTTDEESEDAEEELHLRLVKRSRSLPQRFGNYASLHVMVNRERARIFEHALVRVIDMDQIATDHANAMAKSEELFYCEPSFIDERAGRKFERLGFNVAKGSNLTNIHWLMMRRSLADKNNIIDRRFTGMGVGSAKSANGTLYVCEIFRS